MSTLVVDTHTGKSTATTLTIGSTPVGSASANSLTIRGEGSAQTSVQQGLAKTWIRMNAAATISDSFNISSTADDGTGDYSVTFTNNMDNGSNLSGAANAFTSSSLLATYHTGSTSGYNIDVHNHSDSNTDSGSSHQTFGDLA